MCLFIILILPTQDTVAVQTVMQRHGRAATPVDNPSIRKVLRDGERQYVSTRGHCDCGTVLATFRERHGTVDQMIAKEADRLRRKGWSETKIARALEDRRRADAKPRRGGSDSLELWDTVLGNLKDDLKLPYAGLIIRDYAGAIETESFTAFRRDVSADMSWHEALASLQQDEVTIFR